MRRKIQGQGPMKGESSQFKCVKCGLVIPDKPVPCKYPECGCLAF